VPWNRDRAIKRLGDRSWVEAEHRCGVDGSVEKVGLGMVEEIGVQDQVKRVVGGKVESCPLTRSSGEAI